ncbi:MAG: hypothetical protein OEN56_06090 [Gemmatimonadota bacterium]|nr:hypothetical protein [Gemmatimonadota bacterium]
MDTLDALMPEYDVQGTHSIMVKAPQARVYEVARTLDLSGSTMIRVLFALRGLPASSLNARGLERIRFKPLREEPPRYFVLGIIGRFWTVSGGLQDFDPALFETFAEPEFAKAVWSFETRPHGPAQTLLATETRVLALDRESRARFLRYWRLIGPFSGLIRKQTLRIIRNGAEGR